MAAYSSAEVKSGIFITFCAVLFLGLVFVIGSYMGGETHTYQVQFGYISGVEVNAPVYYAGHEAGKIDKIEILQGQDRPVLVTISVAQYVQLKADSQAYIDTLGMMGEKFIELSPGSAKSELLDKSQALKGTDPIPMHQLVTKMDLLANRMDDLTLNLNPMIRRLDTMLSEYEDELAGLVNNLSEASGSINSILKGKEDEIGDIISKLNDTATNVRDLTADLKAHPWRLLKKS